GDDRLIVQPEILLLEGAVHTGLEHQTGQQLLLHLRLKEHRTSAAGIFGLVHRNVARFEQIPELFTIRRKDRYPDARRYVMFAAFDDDRPLQADYDPLGQLSGAIWLGYGWQHHRELIASEPRDVLTVANAF